MGLFNHLFEHNMAKELVADDQQRMALWEKHLASYPPKEELSKHFNFKNIDATLQNQKATQELLQRIKATISPELISIEHEEKTDEEVLGDCKKLRSVQELEQLADTVTSMKQKYVHIIELFKEMHAVLKAELHLIRLVEKHPEQSRDLLIKLFQLIYQREEHLYSVFKERYYFEENKHIHEAVVRVANAIILGQQIEEELETDEEHFVKEMLAEMHQKESGRPYRELAEDIFEALAEEAGAPIPRGEDLLAAIKHMERLMADDATMHRLVKRLRRKYDETKIRAAVMAFRKAYDLGHFEDLEGQFAT